MTLPTSVSKALTSYKTYKALALLFLDNGKDEEAAALVDQVRKTNPVDRKLIATLAQALDLLGRSSHFIIQDSNSKMRRSINCMKRPQKSFPKTKTSIETGFIR